MISYSKGKAECDERLQRRGPRAPHTDYNNVNMDYNNVNMDYNNVKSAVLCAIVQHLGTSAMVIQQLQQEEHMLLEALEEVQRENQHQEDMMLMLAPQVLFTSRTPRSLWMRVRSKDWWERVVLKEFTDSEWVETFRMTRGSFVKLCGVMEEVLSPEPVTVRAPIPLNMRVAIVLYKLASCAEYKVVANQFGVHKSTVLKFLRVFCNGMLAQVIHTLIKVPTVDEARDIASSFEKKFKIPQTIGCIDSTHVPVLPPSDGYKDFVNRKGWPSYVLQAVVDDRHRFWNINCTTPGSCDDESVLRGSTLYERASLLPKDSRDICGTSVGFLLLGDSAYPLTDWLMTGYTDSPITPQQESFNAYLSAAQTTVEVTFGKLKSRWRVLQKRSDLHFTFSPKVIATCCALHNFCEMEKESVNQTWLEELADFEACAQQQPAQQPSKSASTEGLEVRAALTQYLSDHFPLRTQRF